MNPNQAVEGSVAADYLFMAWLENEKKLAALQHAVSRMLRALHKRDLALTYWEIAADDYNSRMGSQEVLTRAHRRYLDRRDVFEKRVEQVQALLPGSKEKG